MIIPPATQPELLTIAEARTWVGTRWQHQGKLKNVAADCAGLVEGVGKARGYIDRDVVIGGYSPQPDPIKMKMALDQYLQRILKSMIRPASIVWMRVVDDVAQHLGIYSERNTIIHASNYEFVIETPVEETMRREKLVGVWRYRGIENG